jgi:hypothetical protein
MGVECWDGTAARDPEHRKFFHPVVGCGSLFRFLKERLGKLAHSGQACPGASCGIVRRVPSSPKTPDLASLALELSVEFCVQCVLELDS